MSLEFKEAGGAFLLGLVKFDLDRLSKSKVTLVRSDGLANDYDFETWGDLAVDYISVIPPQDILALAEHIKTFEIKEQIQKN